MNDDLDNIVAAVGGGNLTTSCSRDECTADLSTGVPQRRVIVDADRAFPAHQWTGRRCDFIVFLADARHDRVISVPLELKSGRVEVSQASEQLQRGADFAAHYGPSNATCQPVLMHGKRINLTHLNRKKVQFRGLHLTIKAGRCNRLGNLAQVLSNVVP